MSTTDKANTKMTKLHRQLKATGRLHISQLAPGDVITIRVLKARRKDGKGRGQRVSAEIDAPENVKVQVEEGTAK